MLMPFKRTAGAPVPCYAKPGDAGLDLTTQQDIHIAPGETVIAPTGIAVSIPQGYVGQVVPRSGLASKKGVTLANCTGIIDSGYRGEIKAPLYNISNSPVVLNKGERVCQLLIMPVAMVELLEVDELDETERGSDGLGSTGV